MKIAISADQPRLDSAVDLRFGRCAFFVLIDSETMQWEGVENRDAALATGAGIGAAQFVANQGAQVVITGVAGPKAAKALSAAGIEIVSVAGGSVSEAVEAFKAGKLQAGQQSSPPAQMGRGQGGQGRGMGGGGQGRGGQGRGMGGGGQGRGGQGRGMGTGKKNG